MLRDDIKTATITAMKAGDKERTAALRLIAAKIAQLFRESGQNDRLRELPSTLR